MKLQKDVFWKAAILTAVVFILGVLLGYYIESGRLTEIEEEYKKVELQWADAKLQTLYYQTLSPDLCKAAIEENLKFSDKVYEEGLKLEEYEEANKLGADKFSLDKKRYSLLKVEFLLNSLFLKEKCKSANYTNLVYFYASDPTDNQELQQIAISEILKQLKQKQGSSLMLIPLPIDLDISVINVINKAYNVNSIPTILINEKIKIEGVKTIEEIEKAIEDAKKS
jgi:hypothetical protein